MDRPCETNDQPRDPVLLRGLLFTLDGERLVPSYTVEKGETSRDYRPAKRRRLGAVAGGIGGLILGHQLGNGTGNKVATALGAAGGAFAGNAIEKNARTTKAYEVGVRVVNGTLQADLR